jgi:predicted PurR-regulated permease PerM
MTIEIPSEYLGPFIISIPAIILLLLAGGGGPSGPRKS